MEKETWDKVQKILIRDHQSVDEEVMSCYRDQIYPSERIDTAKEIRDEALDALAVFWNLKEVKKD